MELDNDIYSLGFVSQVRDDLIDEHFDVMSGEFKDEKEKHECKQQEVVTIYPINHDEEPKQIVKITEPQIELCPECPHCAAQPKIIDLLLFKDEEKEREVQAKRIKFAEERAF